MRLPLFRKRWDADAAAVRAITAFLDAAESLGGNDVGPNGPDLANREFGAPIRGVPRGSATVGNVTFGAPQLLPSGVQNPDGSSVTIDLTGVTVRDFVHSHPSGSLTPTPMGPDGSGDWAVFRHLHDMAEAAGVDASGLTMYIVGRDPVTGDYKVMAYDWNDEHSNAGGREVNPNAQPCPA